MTTAKTYSQMTDAELLAGYYDAKDVLAHKSRYFDQTIREFRVAHKEMQDELRNRAIDTLARMAVPGL